MCNASARSSISPKPQDYVVIDECDDVYFSNITWFKRVMKRATIIGFTATPPTEQEEFEEMLLVEFFSKIVDSQLELHLNEG